MTNREAIEYIERECQTCKGFSAPENECVAISRDCFESKRLAISALEREERRKGCDGGYHRKNTTFKETIKNHITKNIQIVDSAESTAVHVKEALLQKNILNQSTNTATIQYFVTDNSTRFARIGSLFLGKNLSNVHTIDAI